jgi:hypothetical protein
MAWKTLAISGQLGSIDVLFNIDLLPQVSRPQHAMVTAPNSEVGLPGLLTESASGWMPAASQLPVPRQRTRPNCRVQERRHPQTRHVRQPQPFGEWMLTGTQ